MESNESNIMNILIASDIHIGYKEKDAERGEDSFLALKEIFQIARDRNVDFILLGGDLFHENKPSRKTLHRTMDLFRKYCLGDRPCEVEVVSDQSVNFGHTAGSVTTVNYEDPNINIGMPVFSIHGNHDNPTGASELSAIDILSIAGLLNHFGKHTSLENIEISPVLLQKGTTKVALYGLGSKGDERLHRLFLNRNISFLRPKEDMDDWFNIFVLHQNRAKHGQTNYIPEQFIDEFIDLVVWGHEHECRIDPEPSAKSFLIMQPGSPIATSLCEAESKQKHVALLKVKGREMKVEKIPLHTVRQMFFETIELSKCITKHPSSEETVKQAKIYCKNLVESFLEKAESTRSGHCEQPTKPLIRIRIDYSGGFETFSKYKFGSEFADRVANPENIVHFIIKSTRKDKNDIDVGDMDAMIGKEEVEKVKMEDLVCEYFIAKEKKDQMSLLSAQELSEAVGCFVDKQERDAIYQECEKQTAESKDYISHHENELIFERDCIVSLIGQFHDERENDLKIKSQMSTLNPTEAQEAARKAREKYARSRVASDLTAESLDQTKNEMNTSKTMQRSQTSGRRGRGSRGRSTGSRNRKGVQETLATSKITSFMTPSVTTETPSLIDLTQDDNDNRMEESFQSQASIRAAFTRRRGRKGVSYIPDDDDDNPFND